MSLRTILGRLMLCLCGLFAFSSAYAERLITATPLLQGGGIVVDVFDNPAASGGKPSSTRTVPFKSTYTVPVVQSFKGQVYMFWTSRDDQKNIYYSSSVEGKSWSAPKFIPVGSILTDVSATVFKQELVLTFADVQGRLNTISSRDGTGWPPNVSPVPTVHTAASNKPVVYNGQLFVLYNENRGKAVYYVTYDGVKWSSEKTAFQEGPETIVNLVPVVYNGDLRVYYTFFNGGLFERTYDRGGNWGAKQGLTGIPDKGSLNSATMVNERLFISSGPNIYYSADSIGPTGSTAGLKWAPYYAYSGRSAYPSGLGVSYGITTSDLTARNPQLPVDLPTGLSHTDYATFAWRSFFALNNTAAAPLPANRGVGNPASSFADSGKVSKSPSPLLWQTFAHRTELFPGMNRNGAGGPTRPFGSDPQYSYIEFPQGAPLASGATYAHYNNLDEATQIGQNAIFFPVNPPHAAKTTEDPTGDYVPSKDSQILFEAKANPVIYEYAKKLTSYPDTNIVLPDGAVEVKAAWRKLADIPVENRGRYHTATVVTYQGTDASPMAHNEDYALVALHIIHKTANYPTFIFATFEHEDALTLPDGKSPTGLYYIANYNRIDYPTTSASKPDGPPVAKFSDGDKTHEVVLPRTDFVKSSVPQIYSGTKGIPKGQAGPITVVQPLTVFNEVAAVNKQVQALMEESGEFTDSVWKHYRLKGVQAIPSSEQTDPDYYLANIMVESSQPGIQLFRGGNSFPIPEDSILTNTRDFKNIRVPDYDHGTQSLTMGGCMGCHGIAQSQLKQGFSFLFDAIKPPKVKPHTPNFVEPTGFRNPETVGLPDPHTMVERARKYALGFQGQDVVESTGK
ncbi:exo-alpha-sialidase [Pseudomonas kilonensis]|uniref:exo-alpha-sialidase n=1 Tax=Pseudomonas kilonensis TaxID=132476 RepID=UPI00209FE8F9|nr:exo-alpha-sialidase [Pseudomonas kilonensis]MCP1454849.1 hypothetical protein [Pseudomonas kilonensis]